MKRLLLSIIFGLSLVSANFVKGLAPIAKYESNYDAANLFQVLTAAMSIVALTSSIKIKSPLISKVAAISAVSSIIASFINMSLFEKKSNMLKKCLAERQHNCQQKSKEFDNENFKKNVAGYIISALGLAISVLAHYSE